MPSSASERSSARIPSRSSRSTPLVGSSITSSAGSSASVRAIATRTLSPSSSVASRCAAVCSAPTRASDRWALARACARGYTAREQADGDLLEHALPFGVAKLALAVADTATEQILAVLGQVAAFEAHGAAVGRLDASRHAQQRRAPGALQAPHHDELAGLELQRDLATARAARAPGRRSACRQPSSSSRLIARAPCAPRAPSAPGARTGSTPSLAPTARRFCSHASRVASARGALRGAVVRRPQRAVAPLGKARLLVAVDHAARDVGVAHQRGQLHREQPLAPALLGELGDEPVAGSARPRPRWRGSRAWAGARCRCPELLRSGPGLRARAAPCRRARCCSATGRPRRCGQSAARARRRSSDARSPDRAAPS